MANTARRAPLGDSDLSVFPLSLGGNVFGWTANQQESFAVLDAYADAGGNFVDTADGYSRWVPGHIGGESETIIGEWIAQRGNRDRVVVATKIGRHPDYEGLRADTVIAAAEASLRRLQSDYIDLLYTHFDDESVPVGEFLTALDGLVTAGKVRNIAASNISPERLRAALEFSRAEDITAYVALQPHYNLVSRDTYEGELAAVAAEYGLSTVPYYGLAAGFLTGKYRPGTEVDSARSERVARYLDSERGTRVLEALDKVSADTGAQPASVALAWLLAQPTVTAPIASARVVEQLPALIAAVELTLTDDQVRLLTEVSA